MRHPLRHRMLCALAALSLVLSTAPAPVAATFGEGEHHACSLSDGSSVTETAGPNPAPAAAVTGARLDAEGRPCGPGPCSMPSTACAAGGACLSVVPLPASASLSFSSGLLGLLAAGPDGGLPSPASRILTPPPRS